MTTPFLSVNNIIIRNGNSFFFENTSWTLFTNQQWLIYGPNGSGKSTFAKAIAGLLPTKRGKIILHFVNDKLPFPSAHKDRISYLSFETQQNLLNKDSLKRDFESYAGVENKGSLVKDFIFQKTQNTQNSGKPDNKKVRKSDLLSFPSILNIKNFLDREISTLSTGETRKIFILKALSKKPDLLILDEPFEGLDEDSKKNFMQIINELMAKGIHFILIAHRIDEIPQNITHILLVKNCRIFAQGEKERIMRIISTSTKTSLRTSSKTGEAIPIVVGKSFGIASSPSVPRNDVRLKINPIIEMKDVTVSYGNKIILDQINWTYKQGENWVILGPNGAGKSTLMQLIIGDQLQGYANNIKVFGKKKDIGISVWEIKEKIGVVSTDLMLRYNKAMSAYNVILSGFFDSIGLYRTASQQQKKQADKWIKILKLQEFAQQNYNQLSFGQKRLILIARAVVKNPELLILDEPCYGLDIENRKRVLEIINTIGTSGTTNILLITHNQDDILPCITNIMRLEKGKIKSIS